MAEITQEQAIPGFVVLDAGTGEPVDITDVILEPNYGGTFAINENGSLTVTYVDSWHYTESLVLQKLGNYLIRFADGRTFIW